MGAEGISNRKLIKGMSKIKLEDGCLLLIRKGTELAEKVTIKQLQEAIEQAGYRDIVILIADSVANIGKIPEYRLNEAGFYRLNDAAEKILEYAKREDDEEEDE